jgi:hypothetical protein
MAEPEIPVADYRDNLERVRKFRGTRLGRKYYGVGRKSNSDSPVPLASLAMAHELSLRNVLKWRYEGIVRTYVENERIKAKWAGTWIEPPVISYDIYTLAMMAEDRRALKTFVLVLKEEIERNMVESIKHPQRAQLQFPLICFFEQTSNENKKLQILLKNQSPNVWKIIVSKLRKEAYTSRRFWLNKT